MKNILLLVFAVLFVSLSHAQTIEQPQVGMSSASNVSIEKIVMSDTATVFFMNARSAPGNWISVPKQTYLLPVGSTDTIYIKGSEGIPFNQKYNMPESGKASYRLIFPKLDPSVSKVDYGEANIGGNWFMWDIVLKPEQFKSVIPERFNGNWFRSDNAQWEVSLLDSAAIYKSQVWKYSGYEENEGLGTLKLKNGKKNITLYLKSGENKSCLIGESSSKLISYDNEPNESAISVDDSEFKMPVFKMDTAIYCGYIKNWSRRYPQKTGMVYVNHILLGSQIPYTFTIADNGYFEVKIPHSNPQIVLAKGPYSYGSVFIEPGKKVFQLIEPDKVLFMGDNARVNNDFYKVKDIYSFDYEEMRNKILDFTPEQFKLYCENSLIRDLNKLKEYTTKYKICWKADKLKGMELNYRSAIQLLSYKMNYESAYRIKNKIPNTQRELPVTAASPADSYYSFLTPEFTEDPFGLMVSDYYFFINRLKFLDILRTGTMKSIPRTEMIEWLEKSGVLISPQEKELFRQADIVDSNNPEFQKMNSDFQVKYGKIGSEFRQKYSTELKDFYKENKKIMISQASAEEEFLLKKGIQFTDDEKAYLTARKEGERNPIFQKKIKFDLENGKKIIQFYSDHQSQISAFYQERMKVERDKILMEKFNIGPGLVLDIFNSQDLCQQMAREMIPVSDEMLKGQLGNFTTSFIAGYIKIKNDELKAKIEKTKLAATKTGKTSGSVIKEIPKTAGDKVFEAIMASYKGKVVFVDFWATWCAPCRAGIEQMKPLKDELSKENIVFVYITNPTSPQQTYNNMIPDIKGEHYRLSADEFNIIADRFKISGIPHYVLVGKDGRVINEHLMQMQNPQLKSMLMKYANE